MLVNVSCVIWFLAGNLALVGAGTRLWDLIVTVSFLDFFVALFQQFVTSPWYWIGQNSHYQPYWHDLGWYVVVCVLMFHSNSQKSLLEKWDTNSPNQRFSNNALWPNVQWVISWALPPSPGFSWFQNGVHWMQLEATPGLQKQPKVTFSLLPVLWKWLLVASKDLGKPNAGEQDGSCHLPPQNRWVTTGGDLRTPALNKSVSTTWQLLLWAVSYCSCSSSSSSIGFV